MSPYETRYVFFAKQIFLNRPPPSKVGQGQLRLSLAQFGGIFPMKMADEKQMNSPIKDGGFLFHKILLMVTTEGFLDYDQLIHFGEDCHMV